MSGTDMKLISLETTIPPRNCAYGASKHAAIVLTRIAGFVHAPHGIRIKPVNMAQTATPMPARAQELVKWLMAGDSVGTAARFRGNNSRSSRSFRGHAPGACG